MPTSATAGAARGAARTTARVPPSTCNRFRTPHYISNLYYSGCNATARCSCVTWFCNYTVLFMVLDPGKTSGPFRWSDGHTIQETEDYAATTAVLGSSPAPVLCCHAPYPRSANEHLHLRNKHADFLSFSLQICCQSTHHTNNLDPPSKEAAPQLLDKAFEDEGMTCMTCLLDQAHPGIT